MAKDILISDYVICKCEDDYNIDKHHVYRKSQGGNLVIKIGHNSHMMLHSSPSQFKRDFSEDLYYDLLPSLRSKHEYMEAIAKL